MRDEVILIVSKLEWEDLLRGRVKTLTFYKENDLHHEFGDKPEEYITQVKITEIT